MATQLDDFGAALRRRRQAAGYTQEELAEHAGLSARGIQDLERGARRAPQAETVRRLVAVLGPLHARQARPPALPVALTSFVGRTHDVADIRALMGRYRLVALTGTGGIGKTRLALEVAASSAADYAGGVWLAELAPLADGDLVLQCVASALGIREQSFRPLLETVRDVLADQSALLVLDNCEHVLSACGTLVETLLGQCPSLHVLATSREPLGITGEMIWRVPPLGVPDLEDTLTPDALTEQGATELFLERAREVTPNLQLGGRAVRAVVEICQRLDGVPLAIELAAARTTLFSVEQIAARLDGALRLLSSASRRAPPRHKTLRATFDWSYGLLSEPEKLLLDQLSTFAGGWTFEGAEAVAGGTTLQSEDVLDLLGRLVDKSLVVAEPSPDSTVRYRLQEALRQFSQERLSNCPTEAHAALARHAAFFLQLVEEAEVKALSAARKAWLDRLELELDNFRAARRWLVQSGRAEEAQRLCASLYRLLVYRGHATEGRASLLEALACQGGSQVIRAKALHCLASLSFTQADYGASGRYGRESLVLRQMADDQTALAWSHLVLAFTATMSADFVAAEELLREARRASRCGGDRYALGLSLSLSALAAFHRGDYPTAWERARETMDIADDCGFASIECMALSTLGSLSHVEGDWTAADVTLRMALDKAQALGEAYLIVRAALGLALVAADAGGTERARALLLESLTIARRLGNLHHVAQVLEGLAAFGAARRQADSALRFVGAASAIRAKIGAPRSPTESLALEARLGPLAPSWRSGTPAAAFEEGRRWSIDRAIAYAFEFADACGEQSQRLTV